MTSVRLAMQAKSDQLNFVDLGSFGEMEILITRVVTTDAREQPVTVFFEGDNGKPYKPNKGMIRVMAEAWGDDDVAWAGKSLLIYGDPKAKWAGVEVGGIRIKALSHIDKAGIDVYVAENRKVRRKKHFDYLEPKAQQISDVDQGWIDAAKADPSVLDQITEPAYRAKIENLITV